MLIGSRYEILRLLGSGGCGKTFLARDKHLPSNRLCVAKQLKPVTDDPRTYELIKQRFARESVVLEALGAHDQIPELYGFVEESKQFYLIQEYVKGETITQRVAEEGPFDSDYVIDFLLCILPVISYIHQEGVIHRDLKPDNIILRDSDGMPVILDFGIVKEIETTFIEGHEISPTIGVGTRGFVAREQVMGFPTFSSDLFSLGMTALYMLTGEHPSIVFDVNTETISWKDIPGSWTFNGDAYLSPRDYLMRVLEIAVRLDSNQRFSTAEDMQKALLEAGPDADVVLVPGSFTPYMLKVHIGEVEERDSQIMQKVFGDSMKDHIDRCAKQRPEAYDRFLKWRPVRLFKSFS